MILKELIFKSSNFGRVCSGLEGTDLVRFFCLWEGVLILKKLICNSFYFGRVWWSSKN